MFEYFLKFVNYCTIILLSLSANIKGYLIESESNFCKLPLSENNLGECVNILQCPFQIEMSNLAQNNLIAKIFFQNSICYNDFYQNILYICCPIEILNTTVTAPQFQTTTPKYTPNLSMKTTTLGFTTKIPEFTTTQLTTDSPKDFTSNQPETNSESNEIPTENNWFDDEYVLPEIDVCGQNEIQEEVNSKIIGGSLVKNNKYPWIAALGYGSRKSLYPNFRCGGSLITSRFVLTAAHCVIGNLKNELYVIRFGTNYLYGDKYVDVFVEDVRMHQNYDKQTKHHDIAIVKLEKRPSQFGDMLKPICLPHSAEYRRSYESFLPFVTGWGKIGKNNPSNDLLEVQVTVFNNERCQFLYDHRQNSTRKIDIVKTQICAGHPKRSRDACVGDSGGPLMIQIDFPELRSSRYFQIGVVSFGYVCGNRVPGVYSRVTEYIDWIESQLY